jgi:importin-5
MHGITSTYPDMRQCCAYGVKVLAEHSGQQFQPYAQPATERLLEAMQAADANSEDMSIATDNCVSALGKILEHYPDAANDGKVSGSVHPDSVGAVMKAMQSEVH